MENNRSEIVELLKKLDENELEMLKKFLNFLVVEKEMEEVKKELMEERVNFSSDSVRMNGGFSVIRGGNKDN